MQVLERQVEEPAQRGDGFTGIPLGAVRRMPPNRRLERLCAIGMATFAVLGAVQAAVYARLPYRSSLIESVNPAAFPNASTTDLRLGSLSWDPAPYQAAPKLAPLRAFYHRICGDRRGIRAAILLSREFSRSFVFGDPTGEFFQERYDPAEELRAHLKGEPGHCVTRSGLLAAILLSGGVPARVVQIVPRSRSGHNITEVWDEKEGWTLVDPSLGALVANDTGACSAIEAAATPDAVHLQNRAEPATGSQALQELYKGRRPVAFSGRVLLPEPWLYTRVGSRTAPRPFRGRFLLLGPLSWHYGVAQLVLPAGILACVLLAAACLAIMLTHWYPQARRR